MAHYRVNSPDNRIHCINDYIPSVYFFYFLYDK